MSQNVPTKCVLSICDIHPFRWGSFEEFMQSLTLQLNDNGFKHVIIFREKPADYVEKALLKQGADIKIVKPSKSDIFNFWIFYHTIRKIKPDIVHFHFYPIYSVVNYLKFFFKIKVVYTDHMGGRKAKSKLKKSLRKIYYYVTFKMFDDGIDKIVCVSKFVRSKYLLEYDIYTDKLCVIYNGINTNKFRKKQNLELITTKYNIKENFIVTSVSLRRDKGPHYLMRAIPIILKDIPNVQFIFAGEGECKNYLLNMVDELNLDNNVTILGKAQDIAELFSISTVVAVPSTFEEAFCFVVAEAIATECPVVAFDSGAIKEVFGNIQSASIIPKDSEILAKAIINTLQNLPPQRTLEDGRKLIEKEYSIEECVKQYVDLYKSLMDNN